MPTDRRSYTRFFLAIWLFVLSGVSFLDRTNISIAGLQISHEYGLGNQRLGWIFSAFLIGYAGFQLPAGWLAARFGPRRVLALGGLWWAAATALTALLPSGLPHAVGLLMCIRFGLGAGEAVIYPAASQFVARWIPVGERGFINGLIFAGVGAGSGLTPPLLTWLILNHGWRSAFWFSAVLGGAVGIVWWFAARDTPEEHAMVSPNELATIRSGLAPSLTSSNLNVSPNSGESSPAVDLPSAVAARTSIPMGSALASRGPLRTHGLVLYLRLCRVDLLQLVLPVHGVGSRLRPKIERPLCHASLPLHDLLLPGRWHSQRSPDQGLRSTGGTLLARIRRPVPCGDLSRPRLTGA